MCESLRNKIYLSLNDYEKTKINKLSQLEKYIKISDNKINIVKSKIYKGGEVIKNTYDKNKLNQTNKEIIIIDNSEYYYNVEKYNLLNDNVIKQVIFSILYAYNKIGFIHNDLHSGNVLLKHKRNCEIIYEDKLEVVIMDFDSQSLDCNLAIATREKSKLNQKNKITELIKNILKFITSIISTCLKNDLIFNIDINKINKLKSIFNENINYYDELEKIIDDVIIEY